MGTSAGFPTPTGGDWSDLKRVVTDALQGGGRDSADRIIGGTMRAAGGFGSTVTTTAGGSGGGGRGPGGGRGGGGGGGGGTRTAGGRASVGRAVAGLGAFGQAGRDQGLDAALAGLGLADLQGKPAAQVIARIAEHLADDRPGVQGELLTAALRESIFEVAATEGDRSYQNLKASLQSFLNREGIPGLVESFLSRFVFNRVWFHVESHVQKKASSASDAQALAAAVERSVRGHVRDLIGEQQAAGRFEKLDWFGAAGLQFGQGIAADLEARLQALQNTRYE
jgi:hypothetical protein